MVHHGEALAHESGQAELAETVVSGQWESLPPRLRALCGYAVALTVSPRTVTEALLEPLRAAGLSERDIVDVNQVVSYFNYVNRIADGLGVELEPELQSRAPRRTYSLGRLQP